jgi:hypothetical protein
MHYNWEWLTEFGQKGELEGEQVEPGVILLTNKEYGANQKRKWRTVSLSKIIAALAIS